MAEHVAADEPFEREDVPVAEALERFRAEDQPYKVELIEDLVAGDGVETVSLYTNGPFTDLCRGPHAPGHRRASAPSSCSRSPAPTGAATRDPHDADARLRHGVLQPEGARRRARATRAGAGARPSQARPAARAVHASPRSRRARRSGCRRARRCSTSSSALTREMGAERGFTEVKTPQLYDSELWKTSGHWGKYRENMFVTETEEREFGAQADELPRPRAPVPDERTGATATCRCASPSPACCTATSSSGTLHGLLRVRHFTQDDAHIFCTEEQVAGGGTPLPGRSRSRPSGCSASTCSSSCRRGPSSGSAATRCGTAPRARSPRCSRTTGLEYERQRRRRRVLRPEDRPPRRPTRSAARGSSARSSSTTRCPSASS